MFHNYLPTFILHHATKKNQSNLYRIQREGIQDGSILTHYFPKYFPALFRLWNFLYGYHHAFIELFALVAIPRP
jgi:hypothetical protein